MDDYVFRKTFRDATPDEARALLKLKGSGSINM
jgi:hypothetical protein